MSSSATTSGASDSPARKTGNNPADVLSRAALPGELEALVLAVMQHCRLWRGERADVARELCAHFQEGIDRGASVAELAGAFGDPRCTARLITRARKRLRPVWWRGPRFVLRGTGMLIVALLVLYCALAVRYFTGSPPLDRNILAEINAPIHAIPLSDRAWPHYLEARRRFGRSAEFMDGAAYVEPRRPGDPFWDELVAWTAAQRDAFDVLRRAAGKPRLGYVFRGIVDPELMEVLAELSPHPIDTAQSSAEPENPLIVGLLIPYLSEMRRFSRWLRDDAHVAAALGDGARFVADIEAILGIGEHALEGDTLIEKLVGIAVGDLANQIVFERASDADLLTDHEMRDLAHMLSAYGGGRITITAQFERLVVEDVLQRFFTDNGRGDGRFVGGVDVESMYEEWEIARPAAAPLLQVIQPVRSALLPSRREVVRDLKALIGAVASDDALPPWRHDERRSDEAHERLMQGSVYAALPVFRSLLGYGERGPFATACATRDAFEARRAAALTVLAMELHRRREGRWPEQLDELVPRYLPAVPRDPFDGAPLRYLPPAPSADGSRAMPVLYSIGVDGVDDGGFAPRTRRGAFGVWDFNRMKQFRSPDALSAEERDALDAARGDWVFWPVAPVE